MAVEKDLTALTVGKVTIRLQCIHCEVKMFDTDVKGGKEVRTLGYRDVFCEEGFYIPHEVIKRFNKNAHSLPRSDYCAVWGETKGLYLKYIMFCPENPSLINDLAVISVRGLTFERRGDYFWCVFDPPIEVPTKEDPL